jgi:hypothetical protein
MFLQRQCNVLNRQDKEDKSGRSEFSLGPFSGVQHPITVRMRIKKRVYYATEIQNMFVST